MHSQRQLHGWKAKWNSIHKHEWWYCQYWFSSWTVGSDWKYTAAFDAKIPTMNLKLSHVLARRMIRISAAKVICIHNKLIKSQSSHKATHFRGQLFQLPDIFRFLDFLFGGSLTALVLFSFNRRLLHKRFAGKKCFCYVIQRQTTFSPHNNPPSQRNCKLLCHNNNWAIISDPTTIEHGCETDTKWTQLLSWRHLIDVHQNEVFQMGQKSFGGACDW